MAELTEAMIDELRGLAARDPITFPEARTMQLALPALLDLAVTAEAEAERLRAAVENIGKRAYTQGNRTFDDAICDLSWIDDECRRVRTAWKGKTDE